MSQEVVHASPTKRFFVEMLTRDIELADAILDLLDNCVDGVMRKVGKRHLDDATPYDGFRAHITINQSRFVIEDNCGGMSREVAEKYAFMMGRRKDDKRDRDLPTVGTYGIGMKRSIFKLGREAEIKSVTESEAFVVPIPETWFSDDDAWELTLTDVQRSGDPGVRIEVKKLLPGIREAFHPDRGFTEELTARIANHYSFIMAKGFSVFINGKAVTSRPLTLLSDLGGATSISPYIYEARFDGLDVLVAVGLYRPSPTEDEVEEESEVRRSREDSGVTVVCNDRVVLYCDKSRLTGWGEAGVPNWHPQFMSISGIVQFRSNDAQRLPVSTTKRGLDASSEDFLYVKDYLREGIKTFTSYTNQWKRKGVAERPEQDAKRVDLTSLRKNITAWTPISKRGFGTEKRHRPNLPTPPKVGEEKLIRFVRPEKQIRRVSEYLFDDPEKSPSEVGAACFDRVLRESRK